MPIGHWKVAALPTLSTLPAVPFPASVVTLLVAITTARMRLFEKSATKIILPVLSTATPEGSLNVAALPTPSALPEASPELPPPASVVTARVFISISRMRLFDISATNMLPEPSTAKPRGPKNAEEVPIPFVKKSVPVSPPRPPTNAVTAPVVMSILRIMLL